MTFLRLRRTFAWPGRQPEEAPEGASDRAFPALPKENSDPPAVESARREALEFSPERPARVPALQDVASFGPPKRTNERHEPARPDLVALSGLFRPDNAFELSSSGV